MKSERRGFHERGRETKVARERSTARRKNSEHFDMRSAAGIREDIQTALICEF